MVGEELLDGSTAPEVFVGAPAMSVSTVFQETGEPELERAAMSGLLSLRFPVPSPAELRARI